MGAGTAQGGACLLISGKERKNMEFVVFAGVLLLLFIFMIVQELIQTKNQEKLFKKYLRENYGKEPPKEYSLERFARLGSYLERHKEEKQLDDITWNDLGMDLFCGGRGISVLYAPEYFLRERGTGTSGRSG